MFVYYGINEEKFFFESCCLRACIQAYLCTAMLKVSLLKVFKLHYYEEGLEHDRQDLCVGTQLSIYCISYVYMRGTGPRLVPRINPFLIYIDISVSGRPDLRPRM